MLSLSLKSPEGSTYYRIRTDFWIQNSRLFPDFFQNNNFFFQTQGYQIGTLKKTEGTRLPSWCTANVPERLNKIWPAWKKNFTCKALIVTFKTTQDFLPYKQDFISIFQTFSRSGKYYCWANFKTFSRIQDCVRTLTIRYWQY